MYSILLELASGLLESNCGRIRLVSTSITTGHVFHIGIVNLAVNIHKMSRYKNNIKTRRTNTEVRNQ